MNTLEKSSALVGEVLFPLFGFLFFDWGLYFILLFVLFDRLAKLFFLNARLKRSSFKKDKRPIALLISILIFGFECFSVYLSCSLLFSDFNPAKEFEMFWNYEEMGIQQGYLLLPALFLAEWMSLKRDLKFEFYDGSKTYGLQNGQSTLRSLFLLILSGLGTVMALDESSFVFLFIGFYFVLIWFDFSFPSKVFLSIR